MRATRGDWIAAAILVGLCHAITRPWLLTLLVPAAVIAAYKGSQALWVLYGPTGFKAKPGHRSPANEAERQALAFAQKGWFNSAMQTLAKAGYDQQQRAEFLRDVLDFEQQEDIDDLSDDAHASDLRGVIGVTDHQPTTVI